MRLHLDVRQDSVSAAMGNFPSNAKPHIRTGHSFTSPCGKCRQTGWVTEYYWDWDA
jgi:hypothetical protein